MFLDRNILGGEMEFYDLQKGLKWSTRGAQRILPFGT